MPPGTLGRAVMNGALGTAKLDSARMFDSDTNLFGFVIELHVSDGPGRHQTEDLLIKSFVLRRNCPWQRILPNPR